MPVPCLTENNTGTSDNAQLFALKSMPLFRVERNGSYFPVARNEVPVTNNIMNPEQVNLEEKTLKSRNMSMIAVNYNETNITETQLSVFSSAVPVPCLTENNTSTSDNAQLVALTQMGLGGDVILDMRNHEML
jgi:hypothetical protein